VWARGVLDFDALLPTKSASAPRIHFICGSGEGGADSGSQVISQPTNDLGRLTRALPMFFAEEIFLRTSARTVFLLPWMKQGGFVLSARPWTRAFLPPDHTPPDLFVFFHVDARVTPWLLRVTIENAQREASTVVFEQAFTLGTAGRDVMALFNDLLPRLTILLALRREDAGDALALPPAPQLPGYLAGLEQALAVGLAARQQGGEDFLHQERSIFDHLFEVALQGRDLLRPRLLLINALETETRRRKTSPELGYSEGAPQEDVPPEYQAQNLERPPLSLKMRNIRWAKERPSSRRNPNSVRFRLRTNLLAKAG
jgi:hypothetical protein